MPILKLVLRLRSSVRYLSAHTQISEEREGWRGCGCVKHLRFMVSTIILLVLTMPRLHPIQHLRTLTTASSHPLLQSQWPAPQCRFSSVPPPPTSAVSLPPRWLSELKARIGKCLLFGLKPAQIDEAGGILSIVARDWRGLIAGSEGFLVGKGRAGLEGQEVVWGEMVRCPGSCPSILRIAG